MPVPRNAIGNYSTDRDRIEQGIAREESDAQIAREVGVSIERVRAIRSEMNRAVARRTW